MLGKGQKHFIALVCIAAYSVQYLLTNYTNNNSINKLNFTQLTTKYGYETEEHTVLTDDGYYLKVFRLRRKCDNASKPVILMHGLLQSSDAWFDSGPGLGLGYLLADSCQDLWVGNVRGNYYSRAHEALDPDKDEKYWRFSVDEIGFYDVPAIIDYVLDSTGEEKVNYIGYSQGSGSFFIMCSEKPEYCDKVRVLIGLAPAARQLNTKSMSYRTLTRSMYGVSRLTNSQEVMCKGSFGQRSLSFLCNIPVISNFVCDIVFFFLDSLHQGSIKSETRRELLDHFPAGTSMQNLARYGQSMTSEDFIKYDFGKEKNMQTYGSVNPPAYNLSAVTVPTVIFYGNKDSLVDTKDVRWLMKKLPKVIESKEVDFNHLDVPYSQYTCEILFPKIIEYLDKFNAIDTGEI